MLNRLWRKALRFLQKRCQHESRSVTADILEGDHSDDVKWCRICGAYRRDGQLEWREPRPDWE